MVKVNWSKSFGWTLHSLEVKEKRTISNNEYYSEVICLIQRVKRPTALNCYYYKEYNFFDEFAIFSANYSLDFWNEWIFQFFFILFFKNVFPKNLEIFSSKFCLLILTIRNTLWIPNLFFWLKFLCIFIIISVWIGPFVRLFRYSSSAKFLFILNKKTTS